MAPSTAAGTNPQFSFLKSNPKRKPLNTSSSKKPEKNVLLINSNPLVESEGLPAMAELTNMGRTVMVAKATPASTPLSIHSSFRIFLYPYRIPVTANTGMVHHPK